MFTSYDKAIAALILAVLSIINLLAGTELFTAHVEETIGVIIAVLTPIVVWLFPNREA